MNNVLRDGVEIPAATGNEARQANIPANGTKATIVWDSASRDVITLYTSDGDEVWTPRRGVTVFEMSVPLNRFVRDYLDSMRNIRVRSTDQSGFIEHWRHTFPQGLYEQMENQASRAFGYKPRTSTEIESSP